MPVVKELVPDLSPVTENYSLTASRPLGQHLQFTAIVSGSSTDATPASGGVPAQAATGLLLTYQAKLYASGLWRPADFSVLTLTHGNTEIGRIDSIGITTRFPVGGDWRLGPRFTVDRLSELTDGSTQTSYLPSVLLDYQRNNKLLQIEAGGQLGHREAFLLLQNGQFVQTQNTTRYYVSVSYRISFPR
jgi:hypothetical protein